MTQFDYYRIQRLHNILPQQYVAAKAPRRLMKMSKRIGDTDATGHWRQIRGQRSMFRLDLEGLLGAIEANIKLHEEVDLP